MSLAHVLLTSLLEKPSTGIELARRFDRSMGFFWHATHQQIYRELGLMLEKQWISTLNIEDSDSRKKTYQVEQLGKIELQQWMISSSQPTKIRNELMVKLRAEAQLGGDLIQPELKQHLFYHQQQLQLYQTILQKDQQKTPHQNRRTVFIQQNILQLGIQIEMQWIEWLQNMSALLQQYPPED